jgi:hypothetical protein
MEHELDDKVIDFIEDRMVEADDALVKELSAMVPKSQAVEAMIGVASQHLTQAIILMHMISGPGYAAAVLGDRLTELKLQAH